MSDSPARRPRSGRRLALVSLLFIPVPVVVWLLSESGVAGALLAGVQVAMSWTAGVLLFREAKRSAGVRRGVHVAAGWCCRWWASPAWGPGS
ncbi:MAG: hypothetical protein R3F43_04360 [bacterium]